MNNSYKTALPIRQVCRGYSIAQGKHMQLLQYFNRVLVCLEILNVTLRMVFANPVTYIAIGRV